MKKTFRKILHGVLDLLPITIIGIFAIYVQRHEPTQSITYAQNQVVNVNQHAKPLDDSGWSATYATKSVSDGVLTMTATQQYGRISQNMPLISGHKYLCFFDIKFTTINAEVQFGLGDRGYISSQGVFKNLNTIANTEWNSISVLGNYTQLGSKIQIVLIDTRSSGWDSIQIKDLSVIDLTQALGVEVANHIYDLETETAGAGVDYFNNTYKDYPLEYNADGTPTLFKNVSEVTYSNTDIGSQMVYSLYQPINDYFNLNNVANFEQVYDFFQVQFFNGNAPVSIFIVWNIILYQFIMDLVFLVYMVFMFIIDFIEGMLDFMFRKSFGGAK